VIANHKQREAPSRGDRCDVKIYHFVPITYVAIEGHRLPSVAGAGRRFHIHSVSINWTADDGETSAAGRTGSGQPGSGWAGGVFSTDRSKMERSRMSFLLRVIAFAFAIFIGASYASAQETCLAYQQGTLGCPNYGAPAATAVPGPSMDGGVATAPAGSSVTLFLAEECRRMGSWSACSRPATASTEPTAL
jgi:hypothetical protein